MNSIGIIETQSQRSQIIDLESKLLQSNIIFLTEQIDSYTVSTVQAELLYLASKMTPFESQSNPIVIYINSPGGEIYSCLGLYDIMRLLIGKGYVIETINIGLAASAAAILLLSGSEGHRFSLPNSTVMLHQPSSGTIGTVTDMTIDLEEAVRLKQVLNNIVITHACEDLIPFMERDKYFTAEEAVKYKIIDSIKQ